MLQPCQREVFLLIVGNDLQNDKPISKRWLDGQVCLTGSSTAKLGKELERTEVFADLWENRGSGERAQEAVAIQEEL
jgi:hypothetical protein